MNFVRTVNTLIQQETTTRNWVQFHTLVINPPSLDTSQDPSHIWNVTPSRDGYQNDTASVQLSRHVSHAPVEDSPLPDHAQ